MTDPNDVALKKWQDNLEHFEDATIIARETLEKRGIIYQGGNGKWHQTEKYHTFKGSKTIK